MNGLTDALVELGHGVSFGEDGLAQSSGGEAPLSGLFNQKDELAHESMIPPIGAVAQ